MLFSSKKILVIIIFFLLSSGQVLAQSNFDLFFKTEERYKDIVVQEVLSADTIRLEGKTGEKGEIIQLIGLRAPEPPQKNKNIERDEMGFVIKPPVDPLTPIEEQAFAFAQNLLQGERVRLEFDSQKNSDDNKTLAYVFLLKDNTFVNAEILRHGYAHLSIQPPNMKYAEDLREAYKEARAQQRGLQAQ